MISLEAKQNPLRSTKQYYQSPLKFKPKSKRTYSYTNQITNPILNTIQPSTLFKYADQLQKSKNWNRDLIHKKILNQSLKLTLNLSKDHSLKDNSKNNTSRSEKTNHRTKTKSFSLLSSRSNSNKNTLDLINPIQKSKQKQKSFYTFKNDNKNRNQIIQKYKSDQYINHRHTSLFQNMLNKTIALNTIEHSVQKQYDKYFRGF